MQETKETYVRVIRAVTAIALATVAYLLLLTWLIAAAAMSRTPNWWSSLFTSNKR